MNILSKGTKETFEIGREIGRRLKKGMILALEGDLGGGKTTFTKGLASGLGIKDDIVSPSFTLEKVYQFLIQDLRFIGTKEPGKKEKQIARLYHFDFYRIDNPKDIMGYELVEAMNDPCGIVVIEWAEKIETELPKERLVIKFHCRGGKERLLEIIARGKSYQQLIKGLKPRSGN